MQRPRESYVKPAVIELEYRVDLTVRLNNCKTNDGSNSGAGLCGSLVADPCSSIGS
jgi:hypothetical protein